MPEYRTPDEDRTQDATVARIRVVLDQAVLDGASCMVAMALGEPADVAERWIDATWNGLRAGLAGDDPLQAILLLLDERMRCAAVDILRPIEEAHDV